MTDLNLYRNIGIFAHVDAGKTTTTERILKLTVESIKLEKFTKVNQLRTLWNKKRSAASPSNLQRLVASGKVLASTSSIPQDTWTFTVEVYRSLKVLDGGIGVFCGSGGVEPQSKLTGVMRIILKYRA